MKRHSVHVERMSSGAQNEIPLKQEASSTTDKNVNYDKLLQKHTFERKMIIMHIFTSIFNRLHTGLDSI